MTIAINVHLKKGVLDPQGKAVYNALNTLGFNNIKDVPKTIVIIPTATKTSTKLSPRFFSLKLIITVFS